MLSARRLINLLFFIVIAAALFITFALNGSRRSTYGFSLDENPSENMPQKLPEQTIRQGAMVRFVLCSSDSNSKVFKNLQDYFSVSRLEHIVSENSPANLSLQNDRDVLVLCGSSVSSVVDLVWLEEFVKKGGKAIFAEGLSESNVDAYLWPLLGIREKGGREAVTSFSMKQNFMPISYSSLNFEEFNACTRFQPDDRLHVLLEEKEKKTPIIYTRSAGKGVVGVINSSFLEYPSNTGWLTGLFNVMNSDNGQINIIPALGTRTVLLENYPLNMVISDRDSMEMFGTNFEAFISQEFMPALQKIMLSSQFSFLCSVNVATDKGQGFPLNNRSLFESVCWNTLHYGSEILFGSYLNNQDKSVELNSDILELFKNVLPEYRISSLGCYGKYPWENPTVPGYRISSELSSLFTSFNSHKIPILSDGSRLSDSALFEICGSLAAYGGLTHRIDCVSMFTENQEGIWDQQRKQLGLLEDILNQSQWLENVSSQELANISAEYGSLTWSWSQSQETAEILLGNAMKNQAFLVYAPQGIKSVQGGNLETVGNNYYMIRASDNRIKVNLGFD